MYTKRTERNNLTVLLYTNLLRKQPAETIEIIERKFGLQMSTSEFLVKF